MNKTQVILYLYDVLLNGGRIYLEETMVNYDISLSTFRRYISEINIFLCNTYKNQVVYYDYKDNCYYLK